jgi:predicted N-formylglutamate amidohydrolase
MIVPFHTIKAKRSVPLFIFGDHASRHIPDEYNDLGLTGEDLTRHIAWDIGTETIVRYLCQHFGCAGQLAGVSRLVIDLNRDISMPSVIPQKSDGTVIPGNLNLTLEDKQTRIDRFHRPYHAALADSLRPYDDPLVISVHSFTQKPDLGEFRSLDIGLLVKHDEATAETLRKSIVELDKYSIGINEPYSAHDLNYTIDTAVASQGFRHLAIEINQSLIDRADSAKQMAIMLAGRLGPLVG